MVEGNLTGTTTLSTQQGKIQFDTFISESLLFINTFSPCCTKHTVKPKMNARRRKTEEKCVW